MAKSQGQPCGNRSLELWWLESRDVGVGGVWGVRECGGWGDDVEGNLE